MRTERRQRLRFIVDGYEPHAFWAMLQRAIGRDLAAEILRMAECGR